MSHHPTTQQQSPGPKAKVAEPWALGSSDGEGEDNVMESSESDQSEGDNGLVPPNN